MLHYRAICGAANRGCSRLSGGQSISVAFRLHGSLPASRVFAPEPLILGGGLSGPRFLQRPEMAEMVMRALLEGESRFHRYRLHAFLVMPNHVHWLVTPAVNASRWLGPLKGFTSYRANEVIPSSALEIGPALACIGVSTTYGIYRRGRKNSHKSQQPICVFQARSQPQPAATPLFLNAC